MRKRGSQRKTDVAKRQALMSAIRKDWIEGTYHTQHDIAIKHGTTDHTVCVCLKRIKNILQEEFKEDSVADKERRIKQLEDVQAKANLAWERSKQNSEELRIQYVKVKCPDCKGTGMQEDKETWCESCEGKGNVSEELLTRRVVGQAGEPRFLSLVNECIKEISRLNGLYPEKGKTGDKESPEGDKHLHLHLGEGDKVDPDILIQMRRLMIQAEESRNGNGKMLMPAVVENEKQTEEEDGHDRSENKS